MLMLPARVKACLANQRFQENDALWSDWRLVLEVGAGAPSYPQTAKDHFRGVYYEGIHLIVGLYISALIRKASAPTPRWRPSWLKLILVTTRQSSVS